MRRLRRVEAIRATVVAALLLAAVDASAHGTEILDASLDRTGPGEWCIRMEVTPARLELMSGSPSGSLRTWGDLGRARVRLESTLTGGTILKQGGGNLPALHLDIPLLDGEIRMPGNMPLPGKVPLLLETKGADTPVPVLESAEYNVGETHLPVGLFLRPYSAPPGSTASGEKAVKREDARELLTTSFWLGFRHIIPEGTDHLLFILGLYLGSKRIGEILAQVTMFTVAHCLTLLLTVAGVLKIPGEYSRWIETGIALSIAFVAIENMLPAGRRPLRRRLALVTTFGLIHGLGFAGALSEVEWPRHLFLPAVFCANLGIEFAQLLIVLAAALATGWFWEKAWYRGAIVIPASVVIACIALFWSVQRIVG